MMRISLKEVSKFYRNLHVLNKINYEFEDELYVINGINGSGKSTLVKLISGIVLPSIGTIEVNGSISYLPEKFELPRNMTTFQIINLYVKNEKQTKGLLLEWEIPIRRLNSLSKGNFQKLGILFMLVQNSDIYIFDEPTDSLDVDIIRIFRKCISYLKEMNKCIIIILHQLSLDELDPIKITIDKGVVCQN